jgi:hypothetical protein
MYVVLANGIDKLETTLIRAGFDAPDAGVEEGGGPHTHLPFLFAKLGKSRGSKSLKTGCVSC